MTKGKILFAVMMLFTSIVVFNTSCKKDDNVIDDTERATISEEAQTFTDPRDGQVYQIVTIGTQTWFAENLNYQTTDSWWYNNSSANGDIYGRLYTWNAALNACPDGWHLPSDAEWTTLINYLGGRSVAGTKMKSTSGWNNGGNRTNESGFNALPAGFRTYLDGSFCSLGFDVSFWSSSAYDTDYAWLRTLYDADDVCYRNYDYKLNGFSVRCVKD